MLKRRLIILLVLFVLGFCALGLRLGHLQINETDHWREEMRAYVHHQIKLKTTRGSILDRNGVVLAHDEACWDLAIDYRAMNLDDRWLTSLARARVKQEGITERKERDRRLVEIKAEIAQQVAGFPDVIARMCDTSSLTDPSPDAPPREKILARFEQIRQVIVALRQDHWSRRYNPDVDKGKEDAGEAVDDDYQEPLREELVAHTIIRHISDSVMAEVRKHPELYPGLVIQDSDFREYPFKTVACHVLGTMRDVDAATEQRDRFVLPNLLSDNDAGNLAGYLPGDRMGESGVEKLMEPVLRGVSGVRLVEDAGVADAGGGGGATGGGGGEGGGDKEAASQAARQIDPKPGQDVRLTLDIALQKDLQQAIEDPHAGLLKGKDGRDHFVALVILSLDGQVLAMISTPGYDPNTIDDTRVKLNGDLYGRPLANRALQAYRPGSTIKPLVASAALTQGAITAETAFTCTGSLYPNRPMIFRCAETHGTLQLQQAIAESCNVYFYHVGERVGIENLAKWFHLFGLGEETGLELPDSNGRLVNPATLHDPDALRNDALMLGIGEGPVDATPLQMANAYATLLRGGEFIAPRILAQTPPAARQAFTLSPANLATVKAGMRGVVTMGTGHKAFKDFRLDIGGKTGTADDNRPLFDDAGKPLYDHDRPMTNPDGTPKLGLDGQPLYYQATTRDTHAWFVGYAPADQPKFVVAAIMEFGGLGASYAAPMVREAMIQLERHHYLQPLDVPAEP